jgi:hypothetical protein
MIEVLLAGCISVVIIPIIYAVSWRLWYSALGFEDGKKN